MALNLEYIRYLADQFGYKEVDHNETSRVVSFSRSTTRINVYYTTGTVGTCLNHPKIGKTQLFRRNISIDLLETLFANPRAHTGEGYYTRKHIRQRWKETRTNELLCDSARRWLWVGGATGLVKNERERNTITEICTKWDTIVWDRDSLPSNKFTRYKCGTYSGLVPVLFEVVQETYGDFELHDAHTVNDYMQQMRNGRVVEKPEPISPIEIKCSESCELNQAFQEAHSGDAETLRRLFMSVRKDIRFELASWLLRRINSDTVFTYLDVIPMQSNYHHPLNFAHVDYGKLNYPKNKGLCNCCGVLCDHEVKDK